MPFGSAFSFTMGKKDLVIFRCRMYLLYYTIRIWREEAVKLRNLFKRPGRNSRSDGHPNSDMVRIYKGDHKALKLVAKSRHMTVIAFLL